MSSATRLTSGSPSDASAWSSSHSFVSCSSVIRLRSHATWHFSTWSVPQLSALRSRFISGCSTCWPLRRLLQPSRLLPTECFGVKIFHHVLFAAVTPHHQSVSADFVLQPQVCDVNLLHAPNSFLVGLRSVAVLSVNTSFTTSPRSHIIDMVLFATPILPMIHSFPSRRKWLQLYVVNVS